MNIKHICIFIFFLSLYCSSSNAQGSIEDSVQLWIKSAESNKETNGIIALRDIEKALSYEKKVNKETLIPLYKCAAQVFNIQTEYLLAIKYYNEVLLLQKPQRTEDIYWTYNGIGSVYLRMGEYKTAKPFIEKAIEGLKKSRNPQNQKQIYKVYNHLAVIKELEGDVKEALVIYEDAKDLCLKNKDTAGLILVCQNIAIASASIEKYPYALEQLKYAKTLAYDKKENNDICAIEHNLGDLYYNYIKNMDSGLYYFEHSFSIAQQYNFPLIQIASAEALAKIYEQQHLFEKANHYLQIINKLKEENYKSQISKKISILEFGYNQKIALKDLTIENKRKNYLIIITLIIGLSVLVISLLIIRLLRQRIKLKELTIGELSQNIDLKNKELTGKTLELLENKEIIAETNKELTALQEVANVTTKDAISKIKSGLNFEANGMPKEEFEKIFIETHSDFYKNLLLKHPKLTKNELRLCAFLKMNLSTKEISAITKQSQNSIIIARYRLRKKIDLNNSDQNINAYLAQF